MKRSTLILLLVAVALGSVVYYVVRKDKAENTGRDSEEANKPAFNFKAEDVASLAVTRGGQTVRLERQSDKWQITEPVKTEADQSAVESLLSSLTGATVERTLAMTESLRRGAGLESPAVTVEVKLKTGAQHKVALGKQDPTGAAAYALLDQNQDVALVSTSLLTSADKSLDDLRDKTILNVNRDDLTRVEVKNPHLKLVAEKNAEGKWLVKEPADKKDKGAPTDKVFAFETARASEVIDTPAGDVAAKFASPPVVVRLTDKNGQTTVLELSAADGDNIYARVTGRAAVYKTGKQLLEDLSFKPADLAPAGVSPTPTGKAGAS
jgi:hypothetical protein